MDWKVSMFGSPDLSYIIMTIYLYVVEALYGCMESHPYYWCHLEHVSVHHFFDFSCFIQNQYSYMFLLIGAFKINLSYL